MTYYSDLLVVIAELEAIQHGAKPKLEQSSLITLCVRILSVDPDEMLALQLLGAVAGGEPIYYGEFVSHVNTVKMPGCDAKTTR